MRSSGDRATEGSTEPGDADMPDDDFHQQVVAIEYGANPFQGLEANRFNETRPDEPRLAWGVQLQ